MTRDKDLKRLVRSRMQKTGESYTAARAQITKKPAKRKGGAAAPAGAPAPDHAALAGMSDATIKAKSGRTWEEWTRTLDEAGADQLSHRDIAALIYGKHEVDGWWAQMVTVGYERIKGLRQKGQRRGGTYEMSKSKTYNVPVGTLYNACADERRRQRWLTDASYVVRTATKPRSMRLRWDDGTIVAFWFTEKGAAKSSLTVAHMKLADRETADRLKAYWSKRLDALKEVLMDGGAAAAK